MTSHTERVVVLVDMDCFYCQVEEKLNPELAGKPIAVVQYNAWRGGGIIAVNYPARDRGVTRHMRGNEAKEKCPDIELVRVPNVRGKADLTKYREAGKRVAEVLQTFTPLLQRASVDEAYLDITEAVNSKLSSMTDKLSLDMLPNTHVVGCETKDFVQNVYKSYAEECNLKLAVGGVIVEEIRAAVYEKTGYRCSAGIAHNKILAKLACGLYKPNKQTILPQDGVAELYQDLPLRKIKSLGGKFGNSLSEHLNIKNMGELERFTEQELMRKYDEKTASWLYNIARGIDNEPVEVRLVSKSIGCCKKFPGKTALKTSEDVNHWLSELSTEIAERLEQDQEENNRRAKQLVISFAQEVDRKDVHGSRTSSLNSYEARRIATEAYEVLRKLTQRPDGYFRLKFLGLSAGKFEEIKKVGDISLFFKPVAKNEQTISAPNRKKQDITSFFTALSASVDKNCETQKGTIDTNNYSNGEKSSFSRNSSNENHENRRQADENHENRRHADENHENRRQADENHENRRQADENHENRRQADENHENLNKELKKDISSNTFNSNSFIHRFLNAQKQKQECLANLNINHKQTITKDNTGSKENQNTDDDFIQLSQIEEDTDINMDETIKNIEELHRSICEDENPYLNTTTEVDYSEQLRNKLEFPYKTNKTNYTNNSTDKIHTFIKNTDSNSCLITENIYNENTNSNFSDFSPEKTSPIMNRTDLGDTSKSFFMRYAKKLESAKKSIANSISNQNTFKFSTFGSTSTAQSINNNFIADMLKPGCSKRSPNIYDSDANNTTLQNTNTTNTDIYSDNSTSSSTYREKLKPCPECNETIPETEYISHMDHHMAMKLMTEEKQLFQEQLQLTKQRKPAVKVKTEATKRKLNAMEKSNCSIVSFLSKENNKEIAENMQECPECGRQIVKTDFNCHMDFHAAKKLHLELNPVKVETKIQKTISKVVNKTACDNKLVNKKKNSCKNANNVAISSFFKPVEN